jgi:hypothetical protein
MPPRRAQEQISVYLNHIFIRLHFNPLNAKLNPICHLLALLGAHHNLPVSRIRVNPVSLDTTFRPAHLSGKWQAAAYICIEIFAK